MGKPDHSEGGNRMSMLHTLAEGIVRTVYDLYKKGNSVAFLVLLIGDGFCKVEGAPGTGHNIAAVIDAIHDYKRENPDCDIEKGYQQGINKWAHYACDPQNIIELVSCINYELKKERDGTHAFCVDCSEPLNSLHENIKQHHSEIISSLKDFDEWAKEQNEYMKSNFGFHF